MGIDLGEYVGKYSIHGSYGDWFKGISEYHGISTGPVNSPIVQI